MPENIKGRVPVIIATLCRDEHFVRCVESLRMNELANETELYIGIDFPYKQEQFHGYNRILEYVDRLTGFKKVIVTKHRKNVGSAENFAELRREVLKNHDRYIVSEDDNEFSKNYLLYMNRIMDYFEKDSKIIAVSGYNYPINSDEIKGNFFCLDSYFSAFAFGIWKNAKEEFDQHRNIVTYQRYYRDVKKMFRLFRTCPNQFCNFVKGMLAYTKDLIQDGEIISCDLSYGIYMYFENKRMIFPVESKVRNWGYDGTGEHCADLSKITFDASITQREYNFSIQPIDQSTNFNEFKEVSKEEYYRIQQSLRSYFVTSFNECLRTIFAYIVSIIVGIDKTGRLIKGMNRI